MKRNPKSEIRMTKEWRMTNDERALVALIAIVLPTFALEAQEGRLFKPLAYTKTFAMAAAALLSVTLVPALMMLFAMASSCASFTSSMSLETSLGCLASA